MITYTTLGFQPYSAIFPNVKTRGIISHKPWGEAFLRRKRNECVRFIATTNCFLSHKAKPSHRPVAASAAASAIQLEGMIRKHNNQWRFWRASKVWLPRPRRAGLASFCPPHVEPHPPRTGRRTKRNAVAVVTEQSTAACRHRTSVTHCQLTWAFWRSTLQNKPRNQSAQAGTRALSPLCSSASWMERRRLHQDEVAEAWLTQGFISKPFPALRRTNPHPSPWIYVCQQVGSRSQISNAYLCAYKTNPALPFPLSMNRFHSCTDQRTRDPILARTNGKCYPPGVAMTPKLTPHPHHQHLLHYCGRRPDTWSARLRIRSLKLIPYWHPYPVLIGLCMKTPEFSRHSTLRKGMPAGQIYCRYTVGSTPL